MATHPIGIDLGTTNTVIAAVGDAGNTEIVRDAVGNVLIPSAVYFDDERTYVGEEAVLRGAAYPDRLATGVLRDLGKRKFHQPIHGVELPPEVVAACLLDKLRQHVSARFNADLAAVLTVPAYCGELQRHALADAGAMAGLRVLELLNVPVAAALAYAEQAGIWATSTATNSDQHVLVYELGGFTFEASLLTLQRDGCQMLEHAHDRELGGRDWDARIADFVAERFIRQFGQDPRDDVNLQRQLLARCIRAKHSLGLREVVTIAVPHAGQTLELRLPRKIFSEITRDLLDRTFDLAQSLLTQRGLSWGNVNQVLLVGGATRLPEVRTRIRELAGRDITYGVHPDEGVARGAALYARTLLSHAKSIGRWPQVRIVNVNTYALGLEGVDVANGRKVNKVLIPRGTPLPAKASRTFITKAAGQKNVNLVVLEGDDENPKKCTTIGKAIISDLPPDVTQEWPVDVTYEYSASGRLKVHAQVRYVDRGVHLELVRTSALLKTQVARWKEAIAASKGLATFQALLAGAQPAPVIALASQITEPPPPKSWAELTRNYTRQLFSALRFRGATAEPPAPALSAPPSPAQPSTQSEGSSHAAQPGDAPATASSATPMSPRPAPVVKE